MDRGKVIKDLEAYRDRDFIREGKNVFDSDPRYRKMIINNALALLKEQEDEKKRIMKVIWDTLHEGLSIDTVPDQDWVYEQIRHRIEDI